MDERSSPATGGQVVLILEPDWAIRPNLLRAAVTDQFGRFTFHVFLPAITSLFAWTGIEPGIFHDATFLGQYESFGTALQVDENTTTTTNLKVIP